MIQTSIEQLENDIEQFHNNILASDELLRSLDSLTKTIHLQTVSFEAEAKQLEKALAEVPQTFLQRADAYQAALEEVPNILSEKNADELRTLLHEQQVIQDKYITQLRSFQARIDESKKDLTQKLEELLQTFSQRVAAYQAVLEEVPNTLSKKSEEELGVLLHEQQALHDKYVGQLQSVYACIDMSKNDLAHKYDRFLQEIQHTGYDHLNKKMTFLITGIGLSIVLSLLVLILK